ncbi:MAG: 5-oxoprolinase, partial [Oligoflexia bacterium]|nr:5-oxoprolinase [Oligoflexia bacterium]
MSDPAAPNGSRARRVWMDQGGTFTDVLRVGGGVVRVDKLLSDRTASDCTALNRTALDELQQGATQVRTGTTVATNALLERAGVPVLLLTTQGFGDAPWIGDQTRPDLFALQIDRPPPLCAGVVQVEGRIGVGPGEAPATVLKPHILAPSALAPHFAAGIRAVAIVLVHGPLAPGEELRLADQCRAAGFTHISLGHQVAPSRGFLARLHTTLADAALTPLLPRTPGDYMKSDGGLARVDSTGRGPQWRGSVAVLSGPAGGVVACELLARAARLGPVFGLDMGGTSTDVCRVDGRPERVDHIQVAGVRLRVPAVRVETVAAGGGSMLAMQGGLYCSGPTSAGAEPGPACYGRGGPPTVTDCQAVLGRLPAFPDIAGPERDQPLDLDAARSALQRLDPGRPVEEIAQGFERVTVETMARAVRGLAAARGVDPRGHCLVAFGGAGPGHACAVARSLGIDTVVVPFLAGVFSAVGIGLARRRVERIAPLETTVGAARKRALGQLGAEPATWPQTWSLMVRQVGMSELIGVPVTDLLTEDPAFLGATARSLPQLVVARFAQAHRSRFGFDRPGLGIEAVELRLVAEEEPARPEAIPVMDCRAPPDQGTVRACFDGWREVPLRELSDADGLIGPALLVGTGTTVVLPPGWRVEARPDHLRLRDI